MSVRSSPSRRYRNEPVIADGMIDGSVEPTDSMGEAPSARTDGFEMTAPPIPNMPESTPVPTPAITVSAICTASDTAGEASLAS